MITVSIDEGFEKIIADLEKRIRDAPGKTGRRAMNRVAKKAISNAKKRIREQTDLDGQAYPDRHKPRSKRKAKKMLTELGRQLRVVKLGDMEAVVGFSNPVVGGIAFKQQYGDVQQMTAEKARAALTGRDRASDKDPATRDQARALLEAGYKSRVGGKGYKTPSIKWIVSHLKKGQAGFILRTLRGRKEVWETILPPRSFLGATEQETGEMLQLLVAELYRELDREIRNYR